MENTKSGLSGHAFALITITIWGSTFIFSKSLLAVFTPLQVMTMRLVLAYIVMWILYPKIEKTTLKDNIGIFLMSLFGTTIYFICENNALLYTLASNVSIIVASAPMLTVLLAHFFTGQPILRSMVYGFIVAIIGVALVVFNGTVVLKLNPTGDLLSLAAALCWAVYSMIVTKYVDRFTSFFLMRRMTLYGLISTVALLAVNRDLDIPFYELKSGWLLFSILFLGILASGISYVMWNIATRKLGVIKLNSYIYLNPFITMITAGIFLGEPITVMGVIGALLIIGGVVLGLRDGRPKEPEENIS